MAESICVFFDSERTQKVLAKLSQYRVGIGDEKNLKSPVIEEVKGKSFVFTGTLPGLSRLEAQEMVRRAGGQVMTTVGKKTDFVVAGKDPGSKFTKAQNLGITILNEEQFRGLLSH